MYSNKPDWKWRTGVFLMVFAGGVITLANASEQAFKKAMDAQVGSIADDQASQKKIDGITEEMQRMLDEYKLALRQTESLRVYNDHLDRLITSQQQEKDSIAQQLEELEFTNQGIVPLMVRMVDSLESFVALDVPFLREERSQRVAGLKQNMDRSDVSTSEKYRRIMEAYQIEAEYGRTLESHSNTLQLNGEERSVNFLRVGRIAYLYQTLDGEEAGVWDSHSGTWVELPGEYRSPITLGLRMAKKQAAPDLLKIPVYGPERVQ